MSYDYRVRRVLRVVDGDTVDLELDLGLYLSAALRFRLLGVDTPERGQAGYLEARTFVEEWLRNRIPFGPSTAQEVRARTAKADAFGRWLVDVVETVPGRPDVEVARLSDDLIAVGLGVPYPQ